MADQFEVSTMSRAHTWTAAKRIHLVNLEYNSEYVRGAHTNDTRMIKEIYKLLLCCVSATVWLWHGMVRFDEIQLIFFVLCFSSFHGACDTDIDTYECVSSNIGLFDRLQTQHMRFAKTVHRANCIACAGIRIESIVLN